MGSLTVPAGRRVAAKLKVKSGSRWRTGTLPLSDSGRFYLGMAATSKNVKYRVTVKFAGDTYGKPSSAVGRAFTIR